MFAGCKRIPDAGILDNKEFIVAKNKEFWAILIKPIFLLHRLPVLQILDC
jgi:hypothetical protein